MNDPLLVATGLFCVANIVVYAVLIASLLR
jgi:hypothetical protein